MGINLNTLKSKYEAVKPAVRRPGAASREISFRSPALRAAEKESLFAELSILLEAGLDLRKALLIMEQNKKGRLRTVTSEILQDITNGASLFEALQHTQKFTNYDIYSIQIGEESGQLTDVLNGLQVYYEKSVKFTRQITGALSYPLFVLGFSFFAIFIMVRYVIPMFASVYKRFGTELPALTQKVLALVDFLNRQGWLLLLVALAVVALFVQQRQKQWLRHAIDRVVMHLPIFGDIVVKVQVGRFCQAMSLLLGARVSLVKSIQINAQMADFYPLEKALPVLEQEITQGGQLHASLQKFAIFPHRLVALIQVGEESNQLAEMFGKMAKQFQEEIDNKMNIIGRLIEPALIILLSVIIGFLLVALYLPIFKMGMGIK